MSNSLCGTTVASGRFDPLAKLSGDDRYVRTGDGWSRRILLKKSEIEVPRKSHFRAESVVSTGACHSKG